VASSRETKNMNVLIDDFMKSPECLQLVEQSGDVKLLTRLDEKLLNFNCSPVHFGKLLFNLVLNASEAIRGGGEICISTNNKYVDTPLKKYDTVVPGEYAVLSVVDNGPGISSEDIERVFEPFYTKKVMGRSGTGLGLAVVWNTIVDHDGYVDVTICDQITKFELYFPATRDNVPKNIYSTMSFKDLQGNGETVLVIDDVVSQREIACSMLLELGYRAESVDSGEKALVYLQNNKVDLIILDMIMEPGLNGRETFEKIVAINPSQKAVIASGFSETTEVKKAQELGAGKYIKKPYTMEALALAIKDELAD
jgi:two-component system, cell cycle sensor histidine kinase and response regulator CckA